MNKPRNATMGSVWKINIEPNHRLVLDSELIVDNYGNYYRCHFIDIRNNNRIFNAVKVIRESFFSMFVRDYDYEVRIKLINLFE